MAEKIQRTPLGLLGLLGIKSLGRNPEAISDTVLGNLNLDPFYWATKTETFSQLQLNVGATVGDNVQTVVPNDENWLVLGSALSISSGQTAGDDNDLSFGFLPPRGVDFVTLYRFLQEAVTATMTVNRGIQLNFPMILPGGGSLIWQFNQALTLDIGITARHLIVRLQDTG